MPWLVLALAAALAGGWYTFTHRMQPLAFVLVAVALGLAFVVGRRIEGNRDADWQQAATRLHAGFRAEPGAEMLGAFGQPTPWDAWARDGAPQCVRALDGRSASPPFAILHVRYPVREARGEDSPEQWRDAAVAVVRLRKPRRGGALLPLEAGTAYEAAHNGEFVFAWKKPAAGADEVPQGSDLPELLQQAQQAAQRL